MTGGPDAALGYRSAEYASALTGFGRPFALDDTGGHVLMRSIPGTRRFDMAGPYPVFCCNDWQAFGPALAAPLPGNPVSLTLVADAFCPLSAADLEAHFDLVRPLTEHFVVDLTEPLSPSRHHRRKLRQMRTARIEAGPASPALEDGWVALYSTLARRKSITDLRAFTAQSLAAQLLVPGAQMVTAWEGDTLIGADLYYLDGSVAYAHLSAYAEAGYAQSVSYPMMVAAVDYFASRAQVINLGGAPAAGGGGVADFKRGWTDRTKPSFLCGKVFDRATYDALSGGADTAYFPAYRAGEYRSLDR